MKALALALALTALASPAGATQITAFGQTSGGNTLVATTNAADTVTTFNVVNAATDVTQLLGLPSMPGVFFDLNASSIDAAIPVGPAILQHYSGSFCITTAVNCGGANILSGTFTDAAFGANGGPGLVVQVSNPPDSLVLTSSVLAASDLLAPNSFNLGFSNVSPALSIVGTTLAGFTASYAGTVSANVAAVPEPASLALLAAGIIGLCAIKRRGKNGREVEA